MIFIYFLLKLKNESSLRPNLGHPNMLDTLGALNETERKRQQISDTAIEAYVNELRLKLKTCSEKFLHELGKINENLLIKFDDLLCIDDLKKHGI